MSKQVTHFTVLASLVWCGGLRATVHCKEKASFCLLCTGCCPCVNKQRYQHISSDSMVDNGQGYGLFDSPSEDLRCAWLQTCPCRG
jgi:hypothetical protein